ncbi:hypothetical protein VTI28DRAFT_5330 [Corynascus sepedonium]
MQPCGPRPGPRLSEFRVEGTARVDEGCRLQCLAGTPPWVVSLHSRPWSAAQIWGRLRYARQRRRGDLFDTNILQWAPVFPHCSSGSTAHVLHQAFWQKRVHHAWFRRGLPSLAACIGKRLLPSVATLEKGRAPAMPPSMGRRPVPDAFSRSQVPSSSLGRRSVDPPRALLQTFPQTWAVIRSKGRPVFSLPRILQSCSHSSVFLS